MSDEMAIGLAFFLPILFLAVGVLLSGHTEKTRPNDWVAERHRKITHRGFKSRAGMRS